MSEEYIEENIEIEENGDPIEDTAREQGWRPKEEFKGNPDDWVGAEAYVARGPIMEQVKKLNTRLNHVASYNEKLMAKVVQAELQGYERGLRELKEQRDAAYEEFDTNTGRKLDEDIKNTEQYISQQRQVAQQQSLDPEILSFAKRNQDWFMKDQQKTQLAVQLENVIKIEHPEMGLDEIYSELDRRMAPYLGKAVGKKSPTPVASPSRGPNTRAAGYTIHDLNDEAKDVFYTLQRHRKESGRKFTMEEFIESAKATKSLNDILK